MQGVIYQNNAARRQISDGDAFHNIIFQNLSVSLFCLYSDFLHLRRPVERRE